MELVMVCYCHECTQIMSLNVNYISFSLQEYSRMTITVHLQTIFPHLQTISLTCKQYSSHRGIVQYLEILSNVHNI